MCPKLTLEVYEDLFYLSLHVYQKSDVKIFWNGQWLSSVRVDDCMQILCAHNGGKFDFPIFLQCLYKHGMLENLKATACGGVDIPILQLVYPCQKSYALANIYASVCSDTFVN